MKKPPNFYRIFVIYHFYCSTRSDCMKYWMGELALLGLTVLMASCTQPKTSNQQENPDHQPAPTPSSAAHASQAADTAPSPPLIFNQFRADAHEVEQKKIQRNQMLAQLLRPHNVSPAEIHQLALHARDVFDVRKIRYGRPYSLVFRKDSSRSLRALVYEPDPLRYVVFDLEDSLKPTIYRRPVDTVRKSASGVITNSLYQDLIDQDYPIALILEMEQIFAWQVDFFHIDKNDRYKVIYDEHQVEGETVGVGRVHAALFNHRKTPYYAIGFQQDSAFNYFDDEGLNVRKAFLKAPLKYSRISSRYQPRRFHPVLKRVKAHLGTDYAAPTGTPIYAVGEGTVIAARYSRYNGNYVKIRHNSTYTTQYLHMSRIAEGIRRGKRVSQGETIGFVGSTGLATGPHLCYRFWMNGRQVNPFKVEMPPADPIQEQYRAAYDSAKTVWLDALDTVSLPDVAS